MERLGRHIRQITSSRDIEEGEVRRINEDIDKPKSFNISINHHYKIDDNKIFPELLFTQLFLGMSITFNALCSIFRAVWVFIIFMLIPVLRDHVLPIVVGLFKTIRNMFKSVCKSTGKDIENTIDHYHNNTTNWL